MKFMELEEGLLGIKRRDFMKGLGWGLAGSATGLTDLFVRNLIDGMVYKAYAETFSSEEPRAYIAIKASGAPTRWMWDQFLNPFNDPAFVANTHVSSHFEEVSGKLITPVYSQFLSKGIYVPHLWSFSVAKKGGGVRPMTDLLDHMLVLRGIDVSDNGHPGAQKKQFMMPGHPFSVQGAIADKSKSSTFPAVSGTDGFDFKSEKGLQLVKGNVGTNALNQILKPFQGNENLESRQIASLMSEDINSALGNLLTRKGDYSNSLRDSIKGADELIRLGVGDLDSTWNDLTAKYEDLISRTMQLSFPGINNLPVGMDVNLRADNRGYRMDSPRNELCTLPDLRDMIKSSSTLKYTAASFALAEHMIIKGYTNSIVIDLGVLMNLAFDASDLNRNGTMVHDQHFVGNTIVTFLSAYMYTAFSSCLLELIDQLKAAQRFNGKNLFEETVIQFAGEFNRSPGLLGTDHASYSSSFSQWCGSFDSNPTVIGNILDQPRVAYHREPTHNFHGTWGWSAKVPEFNGQTALTGNVLNTISHFLRVPSPSPNNLTMASLGEQGGLTSLMGPAKIIKYQEEEE